VDASATSSACCNLDLLSPESNQVISKASEYLMQVLSKSFSRSRDLWLQDLSKQTDE